VDHIGSDAWRETIFFYCVTVENATPILLACLKEGRLRADVIDIALDLELYQEKLSVRPDVRQQFTHALSQAMEDEDPQRRQMWVKALLLRRTRNIDNVASLHDDTCVVDTSLITYAEYQLFLEEQHHRGYHYWPDQWNSNRFPPGQGLKPILGIQPSDAVAFCNWLTEHAFPGPWHYRLPKSGEINQYRETMESPSIEHLVQNHVTSSTMERWDS